MSFVFEGTKISEWVLEKSLNAKLVNEKIKSTIKAVAENAFTQSMPPLIDSIMAMYVYGQKTAINQGLNSESNNLSI